MAPKQEDRQETEAVGSGPSATPDVTPRARERTAHGHPLKISGCTVGYLETWALGTPVTVPSDWVIGGLLVA